MAKSVVYRLVLEAIADLARKQGGDVLEVRATPAVIARHLLLGKQSEEQVGMALERMTKQGLLDFRSEGTDHYYRLSKNLDAILKGIVDAAGRQGPFCEGQAGRPAAAAQSELCAVAQGGYALSRRENGVDLAGAQRPGRRERYIRHTGE